MSSAGVALALLIGISPMLGSVILMLAGVLMASVQWGGKRIRQDAFIGIGYIVASAASILMLAKSASGEASLLDLLFGNILTVTAPDIAGDRRCARPDDAVSISCFTRRFFLSPSTRTRRRRSGIAPASGNYGYI